MAKNSRKHRTATGPSAKLMTTINHLAALLRGLPDSLPLDPPNSETTYHFGLDPQEISDEGVFYALTQNLERCFGMHKVKNGVITFRERGSRCTGLIKMLKTAVRDLSENERDLFREIWLTRLLRAAELSGGMVPSKRYEFDCT